MAPDQVFPRLLRPFRRDAGTCRWVPRPSRGLSPAPAPPDDHSVPQPRKATAPITIGHPGDLALVTATLHGERHVREAKRAVLCDRLASLPAMVRSKNRRMGSLLRPDEEEDAAQNAIVALWTKLDKYTGKASLETWAYGFCVMEIMKILERRRGVRRTEAMPEEPLPEPEDEAGDVDAERIAAALGEIDAKGREVVSMRFFRGLIFSEIAGQLGLPLTTVKTRYYRSMERLRVLLASEGPDFGAMEPGS